MIRTLGTILAALLGLAFGSFLNVCISRWPEGESVIKPRSHCRNCGRTLAWWENVPLLSWIVLRGRCQTCDAKISWRYPLVELAIGVLWALEAWRSISAEIDIGLPQILVLDQICIGLSFMVFLWLLVGLATLDAEHMWLPDSVTISATIAGIFVTVAHEYFAYQFDTPVRPFRAFFLALMGACVSAGLILLIRWTYWLIRRREGIGLGDAKLMAMLGAWLGLSGALLSFAIGVLLGSVFALIMLGMPAKRRESDTWLLSKLPLGTFLCIGGIVSALWGQPIIAAYLRWAGLS
jgi:leader peptidase (prepilin peptidase)/N-methyltransferase